MTTDQTAPALADRAIERLDGLLMQATVCGCEHSTGRWAAIPATEGPGVERGDVVLHEDGCDMGYVATIPGFHKGVAEYMAALDPPVARAVMDLLIAMYGWNSDALPLSVWVRANALCQVLVRDTKAPLCCLPGGHRCPWRREVMKDVCIDEGCPNGRVSGHALYRVSPKGELFEGKCEKHFGGEPDPLAQAIERRNLELRGSPEATEKGRDDAKP